MSEEISKELFENQHVRSRSHCAICNCDLVLLTMGNIAAVEVVAFEDFH